MAEGEDAGWWRSWLQQSYQAVKEKARLYSLQSDPATYCNEPDGPAELLEAWLSQFNLEEKKGEIAELLAASPSIRALYTKMVPAAVSHSEFWQRYFYKVHRLEQDEARREALKQRAEQSIHQEEPGWEEDEEEFLGMSPLPCANVKFPEAAEKESAPAALEGSHPTAHKGPSEESWAVLPPEPAPAEGSPSESSESISLVTQIANPASVPAAQLQTGARPAGTGDLSQRLLEATSEKQSSLPKPPEPAHLSAPARESAASSEQPAGRTETLKEEGPTDLRVFELNSDSGKSTPSNNGKKGSSTDISEDWEKDFDLDMTEEEVQLALSKVEVSGELEDEEWEDWE
ncbi:BSD domain-containing protein 1 isoform X3 [Pelecanus crispus]|uniref:BSD domain-containing protein 1 isoform X3 n=1 Tax=Pelecanus crispus TaxID=36300 RepID=UPI003F5D4611